MKNKFMKKSYKISRIIIPILTCIIFSIMFINEDSSWNIGIIIFSLTSLVASFPSTIISRKLITIGNKFKSKILKVIYYIIILPIINFILMILTYAVGYNILNTIPTPNDFAGALGQAILFLFIITIITICILTVYVQTIIVLIVNHFIKD